MLKKVLMVLRRWDTIVVVLIVLAIVAAVPAVKQAIKTEAARNAQQTDIEVMATVGIPAENKLGGIRFRVSNRWGWDEVCFSVCGFDEGLNLDNVFCYRDGREVDHFNQWKPNWDMWLGRYREVLAVASVGEKNAELIDPSTIPVE